MMSNFELSGNQIIYVHPPKSDAELDIKLDPTHKSILDRINRTIAFFNNVEDTLNYLFEQTSPIHPCDRLAIAFYDNDQDHLESYWLRTLYEPVLLKAHYIEKVTFSSLKPILKEGKIRIINDLPLYSSQNPQSLSTQLLVQEGVKSSMTCPIKIENRFVGVLFRSARKINAYSEYDALLHYRIMAQLNQSIEKAYRIEQLTRMNQAYLETLHFVNHEMKTPIHNILLIVQLLQKNHDILTSPDHPDIVQYLRRIDKNSRVLLSLIEDYMNLAHLESSEQKIQISEDVDFVNEIIQPVQNLMLDLLNEKKMSLQVTTEDESYLIDCDARLMQTVFVNLLSNAIKYGTEGSTIKIQMQIDGALFIFSIHNEGVGFNQENKRKMFQKFFRVHHPSILKEKGTGLGLYTTWKIIHLHHGTIFAESKYNEWAEYSFQIPRKQFTVIPASSS